MEKSMMKTMVMTMIIGGMGIAGYMYMKKNPQVMDEMRCMAKNMAKKTYDKLEDMD